MYLRERVKMRKITILLFLTILIFLTSLLPNFAHHDFPVSKYYIKNEIVQVKASNIVCSIVWDYRGFDTLGEATVFFTAVSAIMALRRRR